MFTQIAQVLNFPLRPHHTFMDTFFQRVVNKLPEGMSPAHDGFTQACLEAEKKIDIEGDLVIVALARSLITPRAPREDLEPVAPKTTKGKRIKIPAANGIRYSFGPIWMNAVAKCEGIALMPNYREKLNHQALLAGIEGAEQMDVNTLCALVAKTITNE